MGAGTRMDSLVYNYPRSSTGRLNNNKLNYITDAVATHTWPYGLDNQTPNNYTYDAIGNMTSDLVDTVSNIGWTVYGKIQGLTNHAGTISYSYDPSGQRVTKTANGIITYYVRDAQGNILATYDNKASQVNLREIDLYGSSRLGMWQPNIIVSGSNELTTWDTVGRKSYELTNHLGNVWATITDKRLQHSTNGTTVDYFNADISTAQEYYAFGGLMPGRTYSFNINYAYGFNGKRNDNDVKGTGNQQDYGMRIYDPRVGSGRLEIRTRTAQQLVYVNGLRYQRFCVVQNLRYLTAKLNSILDSHFIPTPARGCSACKCMGYWHLTAY